MTAYLVVKEEHVYGDISTSLHETYDRFDKALKRCEELIMYDVRVDFYGIHYYTMETYECGRLQYGYAFNWTADDGDDSYAGVDFWCRAYVKELEVLS